jgi:hypothetical protein
VAARDAAIAINGAGLRVERLIAHEGAIYARLEPAPPDVLSRARARFTSAGASVLAVPILER